MWTRGTVQYPQYDPQYDHSRLLSDNNRLLFHHTLLYPVDGLDGGATSSATVARYTVTVTAINISRALKGQSLAGPIRD